MKPHPRIVTLRDIAKKLGISHVTVSRALRNDPSISEKRCREVQKAAEDMGYVPNAMAVALGKQRYEKSSRPGGGELAWINTWPFPEQLRQYKEFDLYWKGASEAAAKEGYRLEEFRCAEIPLNRLEQILEARNIQGLLIPPIGKGEVYPSGWEEFPWGKFSVIRFGYSCKTPAFHAVASAQLNNAAEAIRKIAKKGYQRIGFVGYMGAQAAWTRFHAGYLLAQNSIPLSPKIPICYPTKEANQPETQKLIAAWIKKNRPDAILTDIANLKSIIEKTGYRIPEEIALACTSVLDGDSDTGIDQNSEKMGQTAASFLIDLLTKQERGIPTDCQEILIQGKWVDGSMVPRKKVEVARLK